MLPTTEFPHAAARPASALSRAAVEELADRASGCASAWRRARRDRSRASGRRLVVGTGGYAAGVALAYAVVHRIPIVQQERRQRSGADDARSSPLVAARCTSTSPRRRARSRCAIARLAHRHRQRRSSRRPSPRPDRAAARARVGLPAARAVACCSSYGGSQGSRPINRRRRRRGSRAACRRRSTSSGRPGARRYDRYARARVGARARARRISRRSPTRTRRRDLASRAPVR